MFRPDFNRQSEEGRRIVAIAERGVDYIHDAKKQSERMYAGTRYRDPEWTEQNQLPDVVDYSDYAEKLSAPSAGVAEGIYEEYASFMYHINNAETAAKQLLSRLG